MIVSRKTAIILVAGMGTRLGPLTQIKHKCLTEINGIPIIDNALDALVDVGVKEVVLVVGYMKDQIIGYFSKANKKIKFTYVDNQRYEETSTAYSLFLGLQKAMSYDQILVLEGDVFFEASLLKKLIDALELNATVIEPYSDFLDGSFVSIGKNGYVTDWIHKSKQKKDFYFNDKYKTVNIHKFSNEMIKKCMLPILHDYFDKGNDDIPLEYIMQKIVQNDNSLIKGILTENLKWAEIDDSSDLEYAKSLF